MNWFKMVEKETSLHDTDHETTESTKKESKIQRQNSANEQNYRQIGQKRRNSRKSRTNGDKKNNPAENEQRKPYSRPKIQQTTRGL